MSDAVLTTLISSGFLLIGSIVTAVISVINGKTAKSTNANVADVAKQILEAKEQIAEAKEQIMNVDTKLDAHIYEDKVEKAKSTRTRILRYNDELLNGVKHSKEMADACLIDCTYYEQVCEEIPNFQNNIATMAIANIKRDYQENMENHTFL